MVPWRPPSPRRLRRRRLQCRTSPALSCACPTIAPSPRTSSARTARFLAALRRTGNVRLACRELGVHRGTYTKRRAKCAVFATEWDMTLAAAHAAFQLAGGERMPAPSSPLPDSREGPGVGPSTGLRTRGGEPMIVRQANGRLQLRLAPPGRMTEAAERRYLAALSATANVRLAAAAAGFAHSSFYARRKNWVGFRARMGQALKIGYDRLEYVVMERTLQAIHGAEPEQGWLAEAITGNPLPAFSFDQAFQTLCLHRNTVRLDGARPPGRRAKVEPNPHAAMFAIGRNIDAIERANHYAQSGTWSLPGEPAADAPQLPDLRHVTGWSGAATVKVTYQPGRALFGGWRIDTWEKTEEGRKKLVIPAQAGTHEHGPRQWTRYTLVRLPLICLKVARRGDCRSPAMRSAGSLRRPEPVPA